MTDQLVVENHPNGVVLLRMNRPEKKNALTGEMYFAMRDVMVSAPAKGVRAIVFAGHPGAFTAGNDIKDFLARSSGQQGEPPAGAFIRALPRCEVPMIAAVDGLAIGVGTTMILHMDLAYATKRALFRMSFVDIGLVPEAGSSLLMPRLVGMKKAAETMMLAEGFDGEEAARMNVVNACVAPEEVEARALDAARKLAAKPPLALAATRKLLRGDPAEVEAKMAEENVAFGNALKGDEAKAAFMAFLAKK